MLSNIVIRFGTVLFLVYMAGSVYLLSAIETTFNGGLVYSVKLLWLPLAMVIFGFAYFNRKALRARSRRSWYPWVTAVLIYPLALLMSWPYVLAANALPPAKGRLEFRGPIVEKCRVRGRRVSYHVHIRDARSGQVVALNVGRSEYQALAVGALHSSCFEDGRFGIPFRWRSADTPNPCLESVRRAADAGY